MKVEVAVPEKPAFTVTPASDETVKNMYKVLFTPADNITNFSYSMTGSAKAYFNVDGEYFCAAECDLSMEDFSSLEITPECFIYTPGECELIVEPGFFTWRDAEGGSRSNDEELSYKYTVEGGTTNPTDLPFELSPAEGASVEALETVTVKFSEGYTLMPVQASYMVYFAQDGKKVCGAACSLANDNVTLTITPETELTQDGNYDLVIMTFGLQYLDSMYDYKYNDMPLVYTFTVKSSSGLESVIYNETECTIYNLQGVKMKGSVESLAPGIYIINGQKTIVK